MRSSFAQLGLCILGGVIDPDYRGNIKVVMVNTAPFIQRIYQGEAFVQALFERAALPIPVMVTQLSDTARGTGGFGSSNPLPNPRSSHRDRTSSTDDDEATHHFPGSPRRRRYNRYPVRVGKVNPSRPPSHVSSSEASQSNTNDEGPGTSQNRALPFSMGRGRTLFKGGPSYKHKALASSCGAPGPSSNTQRDNVSSTNKRRDRDNDSSSSEMPELLDISDPWQTDEEDTPEDTNKRQKSNEH